MTACIGRQAIVIGAGMGGLTAARALADFFERVIVLERDALASAPLPRTGVPQGRHVHALLGGGLGALDELFPDLEADLAAAGAVRYQAGLDVRLERPGFDPFPQRDLGWHGYALSRPLLECEVRRRVAGHARIELRERCNVREIVAGDDGAAVQSLRCEHADARVESLAADLVVDASGRGAPTLAFLEACGLPAPDASAIGADIRYASALFEVPQTAPAGWKAVMTLADPMRGIRRGALLFPIEGRRWIVSAGSAHGDAPPGDAEGFMSFLQGLRTPTIHAAVRDAERVGSIARFAFPASERRHFARLERFPRGLLPLADAVCRFNPIYGQGMSVAAQEACALRRLLEARAAQPDPLDGLAPAFFAAIEPLLDTPWSVAALDFVYPQTRGERPADFAQRLAFVGALNRLAAREPELHRLMIQVQHLMQRGSVYRESGWLPRIMGEMATA